MHETPDQEEAAVVYRWSDGCGRRKDGGLCEGGGGDESALSHSISVYRKSAKRASQFRKILHQLTSLILILRLRFKKYVDAMVEESCVGMHLCMVMVVMVV